MYALDWSVPKERDAWTGSEGGVERGIRIQCERREERKLNMLGASASPFILQLDRGWLAAITPPWFLNVFFPQNEVSQTHINGCVCKKYFGTN